MQIIRLSCSIQRRFYIYICMITKKLLLALFLSAICIAASAQSYADSSDVYVSGPYTVSRGDILANGIKLTAEQMKSIFPEDLYSSFVRGRRLRTTGKVLLFVGGGCAAAGAVAASVGCLMDTFANDPISDIFIACWYYGGAILAAVSIPVVAVGLPTFLTGRNRMRNVIDALNSNDQYRLSLNFGPTRNGVGLYLRF